LIVDTITAKALCSRVTHLVIDSFARLITSALKSASFAVVVFGARSSEFPIVGVALIIYAKSCGAIVIAPTRLIFAPLATTCDT